VFTEPNRAEVREFPDPVAAATEALVEIELAGICGTDTELFRGEMAYFADGLAMYPLRPGHEWCGRVVAVGSESDMSWVGERVVGDTMLGCENCDRCRRGRHYLCEKRYEVGVRGGWPGALAERLVVPVTSFHRVPEDVDTVAGAMVEPGANAVRAVRACEIERGDRVLVWGTATVGLLCAMFAQSFGAEVIVLGRRRAPVEFARTLGFQAVVDLEWTDRPAFDAIIDATNGATIPERALRLVEPGGRLAYIGLSESPSVIDTRDLVLKDVTAVGLLGGSLGLDETITRYADKTIDPRPIVGRIVGLEDAISVFDGSLVAVAGAGPKTLVDPRA